MSKASILEAPISALQATLSSNYTLIGNLGSQPASETSELYMAAAEQKSKKRRSLFVKDATGLMRGQVQRQGPPSGEAEAARVDAEAAKAAA